MLKVFSYIAKSFWPDDPSLRQERFFLLVSSALLALAWPPLPLGFLAYIAFIKPLEIVSGKSFGKAFKQGYFFSFFYGCFSLYWIAWVTIPGTAAAIAITSLYPALVFGLYASVFQRNKILALFIFPFLWAGMEYFRTLLEIAFPWSNVSYTQSAYLPLIQICEFVGDAGITVLVIAVNILLWRMWKNKRAVLAVLAGILIVVPVIYGGIVLSKAGISDTGPVHMAILQGGLTIEEKWDVDNRDYNFVLYDSLAQEAKQDTIGGEVEFILWPETSAPAYLISNYRYASMVRRTAQRVNVPMLVGTLDFIRKEDSIVETFNAAFQFNPDGSHSEPYHKTKLVPFAETVPYGHYIPWLANLSLGWSDFQHGRELKIFENDFGSYGTLICYEVIFPELVNDYIDRGADFLVNITNDTWYGNSSGPYQHAGMAVFRAIENRVYIARATNSGFSYYVDKFGRRYNQRGLFEKAYIKGNISLVEGKTYFNRLGSVIGQFGLLLIIVIGSILSGTWIRRKITS
ncbi:MAG: apolipoprotein N-acyltransferase [candidate division Zixibacteria bacterium]|nr:apolipoprotein N-acyltransferase [candidate division Zixibacteria bacterium]